MQARGRAAARPAGRRARRPRAAVAAAVPAPAARRRTAGLAFDLADGRVLWRRGATRVRPIASLTKLMTALLAVERFGPRDTRAHPARAPTRSAARTWAACKPGRRVRAEVLLQGPADLLGQRRRGRARDRRRGLRARLGAAHEPPRAAARPDVHALRRRARPGPRATAPAPPTSRRSRCGRWPSRGSRRIARKRYARVWPGAGKQVHAVHDQPPAARALPGRDRAEDRLHERRRATASWRSSSAAPRRIGIVLLGSKPTRSSTPAGSRARSRAPGRSHRRRERRAPAARVVHARPGGAG